MKLLKAIACAVMVISTGSMVMAQEREGGQEKRQAPLKIQLLEPVAVNTYSTPSPSGFDKMKGAKGMPGKSKWAELSVKFALERPPKAEQWVDGLVFKWEVMLLPSGQRRKPILLKRDVEYRDVPVQPKGMVAAVYMTPKTLERLFGSKFSIKDVAARVMVSFNGKDLFEKPATMGAKVPTGAWTASADRFADYGPADQVLLNKDETPFVHVDTDDYLTIVRGK